MTSPSSSSSTAHAGRPDSSSRPSQTQGTADDHRNHPTGLQPGSSHSGATSTRHLISSGTTASLSQNSNPHFRQQRNSGFVQPTVSPGLLLQLVTALTSSLPPSPELFQVGVLHVKHRQSAQRLPRRRSIIIILKYWIHHLCSLTVLWYCSSFWP
jgi:hypothetical protein